MLRRSVIRWCYLSAQVYSPVARVGSTSMLHNRGYAHQLNEEFLVEKEGMKAKVFDGKKLADTINSEVGEEIKKMVAQGQRAPHLVAVLTGDNPASKTYVTNKSKYAKKCGMRATTINKDGDTSEEELLALVDELNKDPEVDGILVQLPLPEHLKQCTNKVMQAVSPEKDVDGFHIHNIGMYCSGNPDSAFIPATPLGILEMIKRCNFPTFGKTVCIANRTKNIGFTLNTLLHSAGTGDATVLQTHEFTPPEQLKRNCQQADIVISATGIHKLITADMVKDGAMIIDVGIIPIKTKSGKVKIVGDVDFEPVAQKAGVITPVPGGVGPLTVAMVIRNTLYSAQKQLRFDFKSIWENE